MILTVNNKEAIMANVSGKGKGKGGIGRNGPRERKLKEFLKYSNRVRTMNLKRKSKT